MRCSEFLARYSDFRDEALDGTLTAHLVLHMASCRRCARHNEILVRGVSLLRSTEIVEPSPRFRTKLRCRLSATLRRVKPFFPVPVRLAGSLVVAAAVVALVVGAVVGKDGDVRPLPGQGQPLPMVRANPAPPFVTFAHLEAVVSFPRVYQVRTATTYSRRVAGLVRLTVLEDDR